MLTSENKREKRSQRGKKEKKEREEKKERKKQKKRKRINICNWKLVSSMIYYLTEFEVDTTSVASS